MIEIKIDNPKLEALLETALEAFIAGMHAKQPEGGIIGKVQPLAKTIEAKQVDALEPEDTLESAIQSELSFPKLIEPQKVVKLNTGKKKKEYKLCEEGFPLEWKQKALTRFSARQAFLMKQLDADAGAGMGRYISKFRIWLQETGKFIMEKVNNVMIYIPRWEENGVTKMASNAKELESRIAVLVEKAEQDPKSLIEDDIRKLKEAGIRVRM